MAHFVFAFEVLSRLGRVDEFAKLWRHFMAQPPPLPAAGTGTGTGVRTAADAAPPSTAAQTEANHSVSASPVDELVRSALRLDAAAVAEAASAQSDRAAAAAAVAAVQVTSTGGEMAYAICSFFAKQMAASAAATAATATDSVPSTAVTDPAAADTPPTDAPTTDSVGSSGASSIAPSEGEAAATPVASPVDLVPVLTLLSPSTRAALVASLLAGDLTDEFTHVFAAQKHFLPLTHQRKQRDQ